MKVLATIPFAKREWSVPSINHDDPNWMGFYFEEFVIDWSIYPENSVGILYVETQDCDIPASADGVNPPIRQGGWLRVAYQYVPHQMIPIPGSEIETYVKTPARWQLLESKKFPIPHTPGVACVWIEGKPKPGREVVLALATIVIFAPEDGE